MKRGDGPNRRGASVASKRLSEFRTEFGLSEAVERQLSRILDCLAFEHAPTAVKDPAEGVNVHIADALTGLRSEEITEASVIADLGSGCGVPGLVLAAALPGKRVIAVEASGRRCEFIQETADHASIRNIEAVKSRAEEWEQGIGSCDVVVARAVAPLSVLAEYAAPILKPGGTLVAWKGSPDQQEISESMDAASILGLEVLEPIPVTPWPAGGLRHLYRMKKVAETPPGYPRRAGIAAKRPLGR